MKPKEIIYKLSWVIFLCALSIYPVNFFINLTQIVMWISILFGLLVFSGLCLAYFLFDSIFDKKEKDNLTKTFNLKRTKFIYTFSGFVYISFCSYLMYTIGLVYTGISSFFIFVLINYASYKLYSKIENLNEETL